MGLNFSSEVISTIAGIAANEIDGIVAMSGGIVEGFTERLGRKNMSKGITVEINEQEKKVRVDLKVIVEYGRNIPKLYDQVVTIVQQTIQHMTHFKVIQVNMYVEGVLKKEKESPLNDLIEDS